MDCNNKTEKNKDSSIPVISNGQAGLLRGIYLTESCYRYINTV